MDRGKKREEKYIKYTGRGMTKPVKARGKKEGEAKCKNVQEKGNFKEGNGKGEVKKNQSHQRGGSIPSDRKSCPKTGQLTMHTRLSVSSPPRAESRSSWKETRRVARRKKKKASEKEWGKREGWRRCVCV